MMGISAEQYCIVGLAIREDQVKQVISPPVTEVQNVYDTRTGQVKRQETVVVKDAVVKYWLMGYESDCPYNLANQISHFEDLIKCEYVGGVFYIGLPLQKNSPNMIDCEISLADLLDVFRVVEKKLVNPKLILYSNIG